MAGSTRAEARRLESALLWLSREPGELAWLLSRLLPPGQLREVLQRCGRPVGAGQEPGEAAAVLLPGSAPLRSAIAGQVSAAFAERAGERNGSLAALREHLAAGTEEGWREARTQLDALREELPAAADPAPSRPRRSAPRKRKRKRPAGAHEQKQALRHQVAELQERLGRENRRREEVAEKLEQERAQRRDASQRAADLKKRLAGAAEPSERERIQAEVLEEARRELHVAQQKLALVEEERDDLRGCLEDIERFQSMPEEEVPSFRDRPLLEVERDLAGQLSGLPRSPRILVVGGGEPQHRHRDKLAEYAEVMGFESEWRMAEYVSWHKEMDKLGRDMETRFDALVVLHWNRTTFTRRARDICNRAGQRPCLTCHYEGFTSLRETLQECLRQLLARAAR